MESGLEALVEGDFDRMLDLALRLREKGSPAAFELEAVAYRGLDQRERALQILHEGLALAPDVSFNWTLLGSILGDLDRWDEAETAYGRARECPDADLGWVDYNRAILAHDRGDLRRALELCPVDPEDLELREAVLLARIGWMVEARRWDQAELTVRTALDEDDWDEGTRAELRMHLAGLVGRRGEAEQGRRLVCDALAARPQLAPDPTLRSVLERLYQPPWMLRGYQVSTLGIWDEPGARDHGQEFVRFLLIGAASEPEAAALARRFEDERGRARLQVMSAKDVGPLPDDLVGVLGSSERVFYRSEE